MTDWAFYTSLRDLFYLLFTYKRMLLVALLAVLLPTVVITCSMTPVFESRVQVLVETERSSETNPLGEVSPLERPREAANEMQIVVSSPVLRAVIDRLDLLNPETGYYATNARNRTPVGKALRWVRNSVRDGAKALLDMLPVPKGQPLTPEEQREIEIQGLIVSLRNHISLVPIEDSQVFEIYFQANEREMTRDIANAIAEEYLNYRLALNRQAFVDAEATMSDQLAELDARIASAEQAQRAVLAEVGVVDPATSSRVMTEDLSRFDSELRTLRTDISQREAQLRVIEEALASGDVPEFVVATVGEQFNPAVVQLLAQRGELIARLQELRSQYPDDSRLVQDTERELAALDAQIDREQRTVAGVETQQRNPQRQALETQRQDLLVMLSGDRARLEALLAERAEMEQTLARWRQTQTELDRLTGLLENLRLQRDRLQSSLAATGTGIAATTRPSIATIRIYEPATLPLKPIKPNVPLYLAMGVALGLMLGLSVVSVYAYFDTSLKSVEQAESALGLTVLATLPDFEDLPGGVPEGPITHDEIVRLGLVNAYRTVAQRLINARRSQGPTAFLVTSATGGEGVSTVLCHLGAVLAHEHRLRVVLVDCRHREAEGRGPRLHELFGDRAAQGFLDTADLAQVPLSALLRPTSIAGLRYVAAGEVADEVPPAELGARMRILLDRLAGEADLVLLDTPPVVPCADYLALAPLTAGSVLIVAFAKTKREVVARALAHLRDVAQPLGLVLNRRRRVIPDWIYRHL